MRSAQARLNVKRLLLERKRFLLITATQTTRLPQMPKTKTTIYTSRNVHINEIGSERRESEIFESKAEVEFVSGILYFLA